MHQHNKLKLRLTTIIFATIILISLPFFNNNYFGANSHNYIVYSSENQDNEKAISPLDYFGYQYLSKQENAKTLLFAYEKIAEGVQSCNPNISLFNISNPLTIKEVELVSYCYIMDYPQTFWLDNYYTLRVVGEHVVSIQYNYNFSCEDLPAAKERFNNAVNSILKNVEGLSDIEAELYIHDYIAQNLTYSSDTSNRIAHSAYGAAVNKDAVCEGQTELFLHLMRELGIPCMTVYGYAENNHHAWNIVQIDGAYYNVDVTWDNCITQFDRKVSYQYYNLSTKEISETHTFVQNAYEYPLCDTAWTKFPIY